MPAAVTFLLSLLQSERRETTTVKMFLVVWMHKSTYSKKGRKVTAESEGVLLAEMDHNVSASA